MTKIRTSYWAKKSTACKPEGSLHLQQPTSSGDQHMSTMASHVLVFVEETFEAMHQEICHPHALRCPKKRQSISRLRVEMGMSRAQLNRDIG